MEVHNHHGTKDKGSQKQTTAGSLFLLGFLRKGENKNIKSTTVEKNLFQSSFILKWLKPQHGAFTVLYEETVSDYKKVKRLACP